MNNKVGSFEPEEIESETGALFRNIYKLEKQFADLPEPGNLAKNVNICV